MRDYTRIDSYLTQLTGEIYAQPEDLGHTQLAQKVINMWMSRLSGCQQVLDVGCGTGFCQSMFERFKTKYTGICLGEDVLVAQGNGKNVFQMDFSFLDFPDKSFDLIFARHALEHSPMPLLTMMEWARVSKTWCGIVLPAPEHYTYKGQNHYSVMNQDQAESLFDHAGWKVIWKDIEKVLHDTDLISLEYWYMLEKK